MILVCLSAAPLAIGIVWLVCRSGDGPREEVRRNTCAGALAVSVLVIVGAVVFWFLPVETSNAAQGSFGASALAIVAVIISGIMGLVLTLLLWLTLPGGADGT